MFSRLRLRLLIWCLNHGLAKRKPWEDPRRPEEDRILWLKSEPKSLRKAG